MSNEAMQNAPVRILVAEDEALIRMDLVEMLQEAGYTVVAQATNGEEAIALATEHQATLADLRLPIQLPAKHTAATKKSSIDTIIM